MTDAKQRPTSSTGPDQGLSGLSYGQALDELEELLDELEDADIDVDRLADRVARGVELVRHCRARLAVVTADVDQVVADLVSDETAPQEGAHVTAPQEGAHVTAPQEGAQGDVDG